MFSIFLSTEAEAVLEAALVAVSAHMVVWVVLGLVQDIKTQLAQQVATTGKVRWKRTNSVVGFDSISSQINSFHNHYTN